jgi:hypothetical protein
LTLLTATLALALPAQATTLTRTFVSAAGSDSNPCTITQPCQSFAHAYSLTAPNGIVAALDPGKYGPLTITGPITINGNGWAAITTPATGNGITINAGGSDNVALIGLEIDGAGAVSNGIALNSAGSLNVTNCTLQNFVYSGSGGGSTGNGILMQPTTRTLAFTITNTTASNNGFAGIQFFPPSGSPNANGIIDHVVADANSNGINVDMTSAAAGSIVVTVSNSITSNGGTGIFIAGGSATLKVSIDNVSITGNGVGIAAQTANVLLGRSVITGNNIGVANGTSPNTFYTYQDNRINLNVFGNGPAMNTLTPQ